MGPEEFWDKVKKLMIDKGVKQDWLSEQTGMAVQSIRNQIHNKHYPSVTDTMAIIKAFGMTWDEFELSLIQRRIMVQMYLQFRLLI